MKGKKSSRRVTMESNDREQRGKGILHKTPRMPMPGEPWDEPVLNFVTLCKSLTASFNSDPS